MYYVLTVPFRLRDEMVTGHVSVPIYPTSGYDALRVPRWCLYYRTLLFDNLLKSYPSLSTASAI